jgi:hypothetical protein
MNEDLVQPDVALEAQHYLWEIGCRHTVRLIIEPMIHVSSLQPMLVVTAVEADSPKDAFILELITASRLCQILRLSYLSDLRATVCPAIPIGTSTGGSRSLEEWSKRAPRQYTITPSCIV